LALTFGTLLSSQGADAHQPQPLGCGSWRLVDGTPCCASVSPRGAPPA